MTELNIQADKIREALKDFVSSYQPPSASQDEVGQVIQAADGIAHVATKR